MNLKHLISAAALLALPLCAMAVPAKPGFMHPMTLPDGSTVMTQLMGDEFFSYSVDPQGFLLEQGAGRTATYKLDPNGARLQATPMLVQQMRDEAIAKLPQDMRRTAAQGGARIAAHKDGRTTYPTMGDQHMLVLMVSFADRDWTVENPKEKMEEMLNGDDYHFNGTPGSMRQYFIENSGGKFRPTFDIVGPLKVSKAAAYYTNYEKYGNIDEMIKELVELADPLVDFSQYDYNNDGVVDNFIVYYAGYGQADTSDKTCIWPHNSSGGASGLEADGMKMSNYCCFNELNGGSHYYNKDGMMNGMGTPIHEFGHVLGMPDLYDPYYQVMLTPGVWSVFDGGPYNLDGYCPPLLSSYERWLFGWVDYNSIEEPGHYEIPAHAGVPSPLRADVHNSTGTVYNNEYFLFETRQNTGWDAGLPYSGMLIWHVDYDSGVFIQNRVNSTLSRPRCHLVTADGTANYQLGSNVNANNAAWPRKINYISPDTEIYLHVNLLRARGPYPHFFTDITYDDEKVMSSFDFDRFTATPTETTAMHDANVLLDEDGKRTRTVSLTWDPVPGATDYLLTVYRINSSGTKYYEQEYNEKSVGCNDHLDLTLAANKMAIKFYAYVRPVLGIPSKNTSNVIDFVANEAPETGIEDVVADQPMPVAGLKGAIDAPADARVFTLTGSPAGRTDLAPGIYLVAWRGKTYKVVVR